MERMQAELFFFSMWKLQNYKKLAKNWNFIILFKNLTHDTPSNGSNYLWQNMEIIDLVLKTLHFVPNMERINQEL